MLSALSFKYVKITIHFAIDRRSLLAVIIIIGGPCSVVDFYCATLC